LQAKEIDEKYEWK